jgi:hypothetical protein
MNTKHIILLLVLNLFSIIGYSQETAESIIKQANKAVQTGSKSKEIASISVTVNTKGQITDASLPAGKVEFTTESSLSIKFSDKIRQTSFSDYTTNQTNTDSILNADKFSQQLDVSVNGKPIDFKMNDGESIKKNQEKISKLKSDAFFTVFPITLTSVWYMPLEFKYVGIAKSNDETADTLEAISSKGTKYTLYFSQKSHLLLLISQTRGSKATKDEFVRKRFYSDYRKDSGLLVPHKITVEENGVVTEEQTLKNLKINPTFKANFFDVKK